MTELANSRVGELILDHLAAAELPSDAADLIFAATVADETLDSLAKGEASPVPRQRQQTDDEITEPAGAYLSRIEVKGFAASGMPLHWTSCLDQA